MLKNYLVSAIRNLLLDKKFAVINLIGLATSMAASMLLMVLVIDQFSADDFHTKKDRIYRIQSIDNINKNNQPRASAPYALAQELKEKYPFVEEIVAIKRFRDNIVVNETSYNNYIFFTSPNFFNMFDFGLSSNSIDQSFLEPFSILLTEESAKKFFGLQYPIGKSLTFEKMGTYKVVGIIPELKHKTHFEFDVIASASTLSLLENQKIITSSVINDWLSGLNRSYVYVIFKKNTTIDDVSAALAVISKEKYDDSKEINYSFYLFPFSKISPGPILADEMSFSIPMVIIAVLIGLSILMVVTAAFNYTSLTIAKSIRKAKEYGLRKVIGASRKDLILKVIVESIIFAFISLVFAWLLLQIILPGFYGMEMMKVLKLKPDQTFISYLVFFILTLFTGIAAGVVPAYYVSSLNPIKVLKPTFSIKGLRKVSLRKILLVAQLTFAIVFVISIILLFRQMNLMLSTDMGFKSEMIYDVELKGMNYEKVKPYFESIPEIECISGVSHEAGILNNAFSIKVKLKPEDENYEAEYFNVTPNYLKTMGIPIVAGNDFPPDLKTRNDFIIINKKAVSHFKFGSPHEAIGKNIILNDKTVSQVIGVVDDYKYTSLFMPLKPLIIRPNGYFNFIVFKITNSNKQATVAKIKEIYKKNINQYAEMEGGFLADSIKQVYTLLFDAINIVIVVTIIALVVSCLGLLGMVLYNVQARFKEIAIRKILGSDLRNIILLITRSYFYMFLIATVIGAPIAYLINSTWLQFIALRVSFGLGNILFGIFVVFIIGLITIIPQILRASNSKPIEVIKYE